MKYSLKNLIKLFLVLLVLVCLAMCWRNQDELVRYFRVKAILSYYSTNIKNGESVDSFAKDLDKERAYKNLKYSFSSIVNIDSNNEVESKFLSLLQYDLSKMYENIDNSVELQNQFKESVYNTYYSNIISFLLIEIPVSNFMNLYNFLPGDYGYERLSKELGNQNGIIDFSEKEFFWESLTKEGSWKKGFNHKNLLKNTFDILNEKLPKELVKYVPQPDQVELEAGYYSLEGNSGNAVKIPLLKVKYAKKLNPKIFTDNILTVNSDDGKCIVDGRYNDDEDQYCTLFHWLK